MSPRSKKNKVARKVKKSTNSCALGQASLDRLDASPQETANPTKNTGEGTSVSNRRPGGHGDADRHDGADGHDGADNPDRVANRCGPGQSSLDRLDASPQETANPTKNTGEGTSVSNRRPGGHGDADRHDGADNRDRVANTGRGDAGSSLKFDPIKAMKLVLNRFVPGVGGGDGDRVANTGRGDAGSSLKFDPIKAMKLVLNRFVPGVGGGDGDRVDNTRRGDGGDRDHPRQSKRWALDHFVPENEEDFLGMDPPLITLNPRDGPETFRFEFLNFVRDWKNFDYQFPVRDLRIFGYSFALTLDQLYVKKPATNDADASSTVGDEPVDDEPVDDEPVGDEPVGDEPVGDEPVGDEPASDEWLQPADTFQLINLDHWGSKNLFGMLKSNSKSYSGIITTNKKLHEYLLAQNVPLLTKNFIRKNRFLAAFFRNMARTKLGYEWANLTLQILFKLITIELVMQRTLNRNSRWKFVFVAALTTVVYGGLFSCGVLSCLMVPDSMKLALQIELQMVITSMSSFVELFTIETPWIPEVLLSIASFLFVYMTDVSPPERAIQSSLKYGLTEWRPDLIKWFSVSWIIILFLEHSVDLRGLILLPKVKGILSFLKQTKADYEKDFKSIPTMKSSPPSRDNEAQIIFQTLSPEDISKLKEQLDEIVNELQQRLFIMQHRVNTPNALVKFLLLIGSAIFIVWLYSLV